MDLDSQNIGVMMWTSWRLLSSSETGMLRLVPMSAEFRRLLSFCSRSEKWAYLGACGARIQNAVIHHIIGLIVLLKCTTDQLEWEWVKWGDPARWSHKRNGMARRFGFWLLCHRNNWNADFAGRWRGTNGITSILYLYFCKMDRFYRKSAGAGITCSPSRPAKNFCKNVFCSRSLDSNNKPFTCDDGSHPFMASW